MNRPNIHEVMMAIAYIKSERSTCMRRKYGAVITREKQILSTGYNGAPKSVTHCEETGCIRDEEDVPHGERYELCRGTHAEQNAIAQAAYNGLSIKGSTIYITGTPCPTCAKLIINSGIQRVIYINDHEFDMTIDMFNEVGVEHIPFEDVLENEDYFFNK